MKILLINNGTTFLEELKSWLGPHDITVASFDTISFEHSQNYNLIVLTGGHTYSVVNHEAKYVNELSIIQHSTVPILGVCLGFELIAFSYGCTLEQLENKEKGIVEIQLCGSDPLIQDIENFKVFESHRWVMKDPGTDLVALGVSRDGIEIIRHKEKPLYGFQFHPEIVVDQKTAKTLASNILALATQ